jgi:RNA polymerase-binding protein DksA
MSEFAQIREQLEQRLDGLRRRTSKVQSSLRRERDPDSQERAQQAENDEVLERLDQGGLDEIDAIEGALDRIADGTYGVCVTCEAAIPVARLEAVPFARTCIACAS